MKILLFLLVSSAYAGTCTSISRTNYTTNQVLESSSLNTNLNTAYSAINAHDGGCIIDGTIELAAFNATDFATPLRAIQAGCKVSYSSANAVSISKCYASVNGTWVGKSTATTVTMGCASCAADSASTTYYIYIATGSTGSTVTGLILTGAPNDDGYDASGNKVVARIYNNASSDIDQYSIDQWKDNSFVPSNIGWTTFTPVSTWVSNTQLDGRFRRVGENMEIQFEVATTGAPTATTLGLDIPTGYLIDTTKLADPGFPTPLGKMYATDAGNNTWVGSAEYADTNSIFVDAMVTSSAHATNATITSTVPFAFGNGDSVMVLISVPIAGWSN